MVFDNDVAHLLDLVGFCLPALRLQVQDFFDPIFRKDVVASTNALHKAKTLQKSTESIKRNVGIRGPT